MDAHVNSILILDNRLTMQPSLTRVKAVRDFHVGPRHELIVKTGDEFDVELLENDRFFVKFPIGTFGECYIGHGWIKSPQ